MIIYLGVRLALCHGVSRGHVNHFEYYHLILTDTQSIHPAKFSSKLPKQCGLKTVYTGLPFEWLKVINSSYIKCFQSIYTYIYQMDHVCQRCHKEYSTRTCADDNCCCWKSPNSKHLCDHGFMDVLKHQSSDSRKNDFMYKTSVYCLHAVRTAHTCFVHSHFFDCMMIGVLIHPWNHGRINA